MKDLNKASESAQLVAVKQNSYAVRHIKTPSIDILCLALAKASSHRDKALLKLCSKLLQSSQRHSSP